MHNPKLPNIQTVLLPTIVHCSNVMILHFTIVLTIHKEFEPDNTIYGILK